MKLSVFQALAFPCLLLADAFPVSEDCSPKIIGPHQVQVKAHPGELLHLHCKALTNCADDITLIYWLINDTFPEDTSSSDRLVELEESTTEKGTMLKKGLLLKDVTSEDFKTNFTCAVTNTAGAAYKTITLKSDFCDCKRHKKQKTPPVGAEKKRY